MNEITKLLSDMVDIESKKSSFEFGKTGERFKVYMDLSNPKECKDKIDRAIGIKQYVRDLTGEESESKREQKAEQFLQEASNDLSSDKEE